MRSISQLVSEGFIWGVGITRPRHGRERSAAFFITGVLAATIAFVASMFFVLKGVIY
ncbi:MAG: hypothetical protein PW792_17640 [Acidobacteriaceae bacterium]|nr:hypothetical protein [Acidobacteriaceae bacterium]